MFTSKFKNKIIKKKNSRRKRNNIKYIGGANYPGQPSNLGQPETFSYQDIFKEQTMSDGKVVWSIKTPEEINQLFSSLVPKIVNEYAGKNIKKKNGKYLNQDGSERSDDSKPFIDFFKEKLFEYMSTLSDFIDRQTKFKSIKTTNLQRIYQDKSFSYLKKKTTDQLGEFNPEMISIINYNNLDCITKDHDCNSMVTDKYDKSSLPQPTNQDKYFNFSLVKYYPFLNKLDSDGLNELIISTRTNRSNKVYITNLYYLGEDKSQEDQKSVVLNYTSPSTIKVISGFSYGAIKGIEYESPSGYNNLEDFESNPSFDNSPSLGDLFSELSSCLDKDNKLQMDSYEHLSDYFSVPSGHPDLQDLFDLLKEKDKNLIIKCIDIISFEGLPKVDESSNDKIQEGKIEFLVRLLDDSMFDQNGNWYPPSTITNIPLSYQQILAQAKVQLPYQAVLPPTAVPEAASVEPLPVASVEPLPVASGEQLPVASVEPLPVASGEQLPAAYAVTPTLPVASVEPLPVASGEQLPAAYAVTPTLPVASVEPLPVASGEQLPAAYAVTPTLPVPVSEVPTQLQNGGGKKKIRNQKLSLKRKLNNKQINRSKNNSKRKSFKQTNQSQVSNRLIKTTNKLLKNSKNNQAKTSYKV